MSLRMRAPEMLTLADMDLFGRPVHVTFRIAAVVTSVKKFDAHLICRIRKRGRFECKTNLLTVLHTLICRAFDFRLSFCTKNPMIIQTYASRAFLTCRTLLTFACSRILFEHCGKISNVSPPCLFFRAMLKTMHRLSACICDFH